MMDYFKTGSFKCAALSATLGLVISSSCFAVTPTQAQIEQFKRLPAAQQQQLAKSYGVDLSAITASSAPKTVEAPQEPALEPRKAESAEVVNYSNDEQAQETSLKRFGYDLFAAKPTTFAQVANVPVPSNYTLGPGDSLKIQLYGKVSDQLELMIDRDGNVDFPDLGPISLAGSTFSEAKEVLTTRIKQQIIGVNSSITMGELRSIQVFVLGDAYTPGLYTISALSNISHALYQSGGIASTGSLRHIQLKRQGLLVAELDLYDLLLKGDTRADARLMPGDVVFIPPSKGAVAVDGEVRRPAIYELKQGQTVADAIAMAGGLLPKAYPKQSLLTGFDSNKIKQVISLDLTQSKALHRPLHSGDYIEVRSAKDTVENGVLLLGAAAHPGYYAWQEGMRFSDVLPSFESSLLPETDLDYALIVSENSQTGEISLKQVNVGKALTQPHSAFDVVLSNKDRVIVFNRLGAVEEQDANAKNPQAEALLTLQNATPAQRRTLLANAQHYSRRALLTPVLNRVTSQAKPGELAKLVQVGGAVKAPGVYPLIEGAKLTDVIEAAGGMVESADAGKAEITRIQMVNGNEVTANHFSVSVLDAYQHPEQHNLAIQAKDIVTVQTLLGWRDNPVITVKGEVRYPGTYSINRGETIMDVLARVGGFTPYADVDGVIFTRESIRERQRAQLERLGEQLRKQLASTSLRTYKGTNASPLSDYDTMQKLIADISASEPVGRLVINMPQMLTGDTRYNIDLENGDALIIPPRRNSVGVIGEVQLESTHFYNRDLTMRDYIQLSGGMRQQADGDRIYIVKASGEVVKPTSAIPFMSADASLEPGDTVVVPLDVEYMDNLTLWSSITGILYNSAVAVAAIGSL